MPDEIKINEFGYAYRVLPDGRCLHILPMTFDKYRLTISESEHSGCYIDGW